jgi:hypothetical protein
MDIRQAEVELFHADRRTDKMKVTVALALFCDMPKELSDEQIKIASFTQPRVEHCTEFKWVNLIFSLRSFHSFLNTANLLHFQ